MSRFRPGRRKDDRPEGEPFDGRDYAGDAYDEGLYRDDPLRGGYAAPGDSDPGGRARSDAGPDDLDRSAEGRPGPATTGRTYRGFARTTMSSSPPR